MKAQKNNFINRYYGNNHAAKVIYGIVLTFVVLIGLSASRPSSPQSAAVDALIGALTIVIAEDYAEIIGFTIKNKRALTKQERREIFDDTFAIATFCLIPAIVLLISASGLYGITTAFNISFAYCLFVLFVFSYWAGRLSNYSKQKSAFIAVINALIGLIIILVKYIFSH